MFIVDLHTHEQLVLSRVVPEVSSSVLGANEEVALGEVSLPTLLFLLSLPPPSSVLQRIGDDHTRRATSRMPRPCSKRATARYLRASNSSALPSGLMHYNIVPLAMQGSINGTH